MFRSRLVGFAIVLPGLVGCQADVSLGRWGKGEFTTTTVVVGDAGSASTLVGADSTSVASPPVTPTPSVDASVPAEAGPGETQVTTGSTSAAEEAGAGGNPVPACLEGLGAGIQSTLSDAIAVTETSTDWSLPEPTTGMEWTLTIEYDPPDPPVVGQLPSVGYYWHNQFSFVPGIAGRIGVQEQGFYDQEAPPNQYTKMAVFWLSGPPLDAELGDIAFPDARVASEKAVGLDWMTIHAKFEWEVCHTYRFRVDIESLDADGNMWYGAWIIDETDDEVTFLGRMLMPKDSGLLSTLSSTRTSPIRFNSPSCSQLYQTSAIFGAPTSMLGQKAVRVADHFFQPFGCRPSLIADYDGAVRHQLSVPAL